MDISETSHSRCAFRQRSSPVRPPGWASFCLRLAIDQRRAQRFYFASFVSGFATSNTELRSRRRRLNKSSPVSCCGLVRHLLLNKMLIVRAPRIMGSTLNVPRVVAILDSNQSSPLPSIHVHPLKHITSRHTSPLRRGLLIARVVCLSVRRSGLLPTLIRCTYFRLFEARRTVTPGARMCFYWSRLLHC